MNVKISKMKIKMVLTDCDGCLTDGGMYYTEAGDEIKKFNTRDGMAIRLLKEAGIITGVVTGEDRELNRRRFEKLGVDEYFPGVVDKLSVVKSLCSKYGISYNNIAYLGDDLGDIEVMKLVGISFSPQDGQLEAKKVANIITETKGGDGVLREVARIIMDNKGDKSK